MSKREYNVWDDHSYEKSSKMIFQNKKQGNEDYEEEDENMDDQSGRNGFEDYERGYDIIDDERNVNSSKFKIQYLKKRKELSEIRERNSEIQENCKDGDVTQQKKNGRKLKQKVTDKYTEYQYDDVVFFIELVEQHSVLWDSSRTNSCRKETQRKLFDQIEAACGGTAQKLWNDLKKDYVDNKKKVQKAKSGAGVSDLNDFRFEKHLKFLDLALEKRSVKTAYVFGDDEDIIIESDDEDVQCDDDCEKPVVETPKRKLNVSEKSTPKSRKRETPYDLLMKKLEKSDEAIVKALEDVREGNCCDSERICKTFQKHVENWPEVDRYLAESSVLQHIKTLKLSGPEAVPSNYLHQPHQQRMRPQMQMQEQNHFRHQLHVPQHQNYFPNTSLDEASLSNPQNYNSHRNYDPFGDSIFDMNLQ